MRYRWLNCLQIPAFKVSSPGPACNECSYRNRRFRELRTPIVREADHSVKWIALSVIERIGYLALVEIEQLLDSRDLREEGVGQGDPPESLEGHLIMGNGLHGC